MSRKSRCDGGHFIDDLVVEILARLPTKSLRRFQCVSKAWRGFISDVSPRRRLLLPMSGLFLCIRLPATLANWKYVPISDDDDEGLCSEFQSRLSSLPFHSKSAMSDSCNGLLLFTVFGDSTDSYFVWNPATMELVALPEPSCHFSYFRALVFDPLEAPHFKVVRFCFPLHGSVVVEIYSSISGNWVDLTFPADQYDVSLRSCTVFHKGALYRIGQSKGLVRFDVDNESFQILPFPRKQSSKLCIGESRGRLYFAIELCNRSELEIWMLDDEGSFSASKWLLKHTMSTELLNTHLLTSDPRAMDPLPSTNICPIAFHPNSEVIYLSTPGKILAYLPSSGELEEVCQVSPLWTSVYTITPCLESINPPGACIYPTMKTGQINSVL